MLENIIKNPIDTPRGYKNPDNGIALRGPLSQFFSALYLKPLGYAFNTMDVTYLRYQELMEWFIQACWDSTAKDIAATILRERLTLTSHEMLSVGLTAHATA